MDELIQRLRVEPAASHFLKVGDLVESLVAERKEAADRIAELGAEVERLRDELSLCCELKREYQADAATLRQLLAEYGLAPTVAVTSHFGAIGFSSAKRIPPVGTELITRPRKGDGHGN